MLDIIVWKLFDMIITLMIYNKLKIIIWLIWVYYNAIWFSVIADLKFVKLKFIDSKFVKLNLIIEKSI